MIGLMVVAGGVIIIGGSLNPHKQRDTGYWAELGLGVALVLLGGLLAWTF